MVSLLSMETLTKITPKRASIRGLLETPEAALKNKIKIKSPSPHRPKGSLGSDTAGF